MHAEGQKNPWLRSSVPGYVILVLGCVCGMHGRQIVHPHGSPTGTLSGLEQLLHCISWIKPVHIVVMSSASTSSTKAAPESLIEASMRVEITIA